MSIRRRKSELSDTMLEVGEKLYPRLYRRFKDLRPFQEARQWARTLDWRNSPYDRFVLRRELLHHVEIAAFRNPERNVFALASREEIAAEVDHLMDEYREDYGDVFFYVLTFLPWDLASQHRATPLRGRRREDEIG